MRNRQLHAFSGSVYEDDGNRGEKVTIVSVTYEGFIYLDNGRASGKPKRSWTVRIEQCTKTETSQNQTRTSHAIVHKKEEQFHSLEKTLARIKELRQAARTAFPGIVFFDKYW